MKDFILLIREDLDRLSQMSEEQMENDIRQVTAWIETLAAKGQYIGGQPLEPTGAVIRKGQVTESPLLELKEGLSGYILFRAESLSAAVALAQTFPGAHQGLTLEVRPVLAVPGAP